MANPNDALLFWSDHAIQSDHARQESAGMDDSQPRTDAIVPGLGELAVLGAQREGDRDSRQGEEAEVAVRSMVRRSRGPGALTVARVDRQLPAHGADGHRACGSVRRTAFTDLRDR